MSPKVMMQGAVWFLTFLNKQGQKSLESLFFAF